MVATILLMVRQLRPAQDPPLLEVTLDPSLPPRECYHDDDDDYDDDDYGDDDDDDYDEVDEGDVAHEDKDGEGKEKVDHVFMQARLTLKLC